MPKQPSRYQVRIASTKEAQPGSALYEVDKLTEDFELQAKYYVQESSAGGLTCTCPAHKPWCRHMDVLRAFQAEERIGTNYSYIFDTKTWIEPLNINTGEDNA